MSLPRVQSLIVNKLFELGKLTAVDRDSLLGTKTEMTGSAMEKMLVDDYKVTEFQILVAKAKAFNINPFSGRRYILNERTFEKLEESFCVENSIVPVGMIGSHIVIASANPFDLEITRTIKKMTECEVTVLLAAEKDIESILKASKKTHTAQNVGYGDVVEALSEDFEINISDLDEDDLEDEDSAPIIQLSNRIIEEAFYAGASDIHIEPDEDQCRVRMRIDGECVDKLTLPKRIAVILVTRLKVMANLDIAEKRIPQDGRIVFQQFSKKPIDIDLRVSTAPLNHGEGMVMRLLDKQKSTLPLKSLGFEDENLKVYEGLINTPFGMILHCGPTGSGKSMTLYSALNHINRPELVIRTVEDPIEYTLPGLCQMEMRHKIGLNFATALRSILRQDPDVILVGEIRDRETASIAVEAALTGHLLFSTLHTNDASSTISRLTDMEIEPFMISGSLIAVCAQRLMRRVCQSCKQSYTPEDREAEIMEAALEWNGLIYKANQSGCPSCNRSGYKGRIGIHEIMVNTEDLTHAINHGENANRLKEIAMMGGMKTLHQDSLMKVKAGMSTLEEAIATVPPDKEDIEMLRQEMELTKAMRSKESSDRASKIEELKRQAEDAVK